MPWRRAGKVIGTTLALLGLSLFFMGEGSVLALDPIAAANELMALTNISRTSNGVPALPRDVPLASVAVDRSQDMIARNYFSHFIPPDNETVADIMERGGIRFRAVGENIEWNNASDFTTVQFASNDFMNSPNHRANVLNTRWDRLGTGVDQGSSKKMYTVLFTQSPAAPPPAPTPTPTPTPIPPKPIATAAGILPQATPTNTPTPGPSPTETRQSGISFPNPSGEATETVAAEASPTPTSSPTAEPTPGSTRGEQVEVAVAPTGLLDSLINRLLRLFLNL